MCLLKKSLLNSQTAEDAVIAEHRLFITLGFRLAPVPALLCLDHWVESLEGKKQNSGSCYILLKPDKHHG